MFVREITDLIHSWCIKTKWREIALKAVMIMPSLLLQKVSPKSKSSENKKLIERRIALWQNGQVSELLRECIAIQSRLPNTVREVNPEQTAKKFANFVINGNINGALRLLENNDAGRGGILPMNESTVQQLHKKHPKVGDLYDGMVLQEPVKMLILSYLRQSMRDLYNKKTKRSSGPSKFDADDWKRILGTKIFASEAVDLAEAIGGMTKQQCRETLSDPEVSRL